MASPRLLKRFQENIYAGPFWGDPSLWSQVNSGRGYPSHWSQVPSQGVPQYLVPGPFQGYPKSGRGNPPIQDRGTPDRIGYPPIHESKCCCAEGSKRLLRSRKGTCLFSVCINFAPHIYQICWCVI